MRCLPSCSPPCRDRQPPFLVENRTAAALEVGFFPPSALPDGGVSYDRPRSMLRVDPGQALECDLDPKAPSLSGARRAIADGGGGGGGGSGAVDSAGPDLVPSPRHSAAGDGNRGGATGGGGGGGGAWGDPEDEDAFLDCLLQVLFLGTACTAFFVCTAWPGIFKGRCAVEGDAEQRPGDLPFPRSLQEELRARGLAQPQPPAVLKFRAPGTKEWGHPCVLSPGAHAAGESSVLISRVCATTRVVVAAPAADGSAAAQGVPLAPVQATEQQQQQQADLPSPLRLCLDLRQLQVCLWDDERRRLAAATRRGAAAASSDGDHSEEEGDSDGEEGGATARAAAARRRADTDALGREICCLSLDGLAVRASREPAEGEGGAAGGRLVAYSARLEAQALQWDVYLQGSEGLVLLASAPEAAPAAAAAASSRPAPLALGIEVHHAPSPGGRRSFRNAWVRRLSGRLPTLAATVDDGLLLFAKRAQQVLMGAGASAAAEEEDGALLGTSAAAGAVLDTPEQSPAGSPGQPPRQQQPAPPPEELSLLRELEAEAAGAASSRLHISDASVGPLRLMLDVHVSTGTAGVPVAIDTHRCGVGGGGSLVLSALLLPGDAVFLRSESGRAVTREQHK